MARPKIQEWPRIRRRKNPGGSVSYLVDVCTATNRERLFFKSRQEAEVFAAQKRIERQNNGTAAFEMPEAIRAEAARLWKRLQEVGASLTEAGDFYFLHKKRKADPEDGCRGDRGNGAETPHARPQRGLHEVPRGCAE